MATNRFETPRVYNYNLEFAPQQEFVPNFAALDELLGQQNLLYNQALAVGEMVPQHIQTQAERDAVNQYVEGVRQQVDDVSRTYASQGLTQGNRQRQSLMRQVRRDWSPGGKAAQFQSNLAQYQSYRDQLNAMYEDGEITSTKRDALLNMSTTAFGSSFGEDGAFNPFSGISAARDINLAEFAADLVDGWMADQAVSGPYTILNGQYYNTVTKKYVDKDEVYDHALSALQGDAGVMAYVQQEALMRGLEGEAASKYTQGLLHNAAAFAANKEGFEEYSSDRDINWMLRDEMKRAHDYALEDYKYNMGEGEQTTQAYTVGSGLTIPDYKDGQVLTGYTNETKVVYRGGTGFSEVVKAPVYEQLSPEDFYKRNRDKPEYQWMRTVLEATDRKRDGVNFESDESYWRRVIAAGESMNENLQTQTGNYTSYGANRSKDRTASIFGQPGTTATGDAANRTFYLKSPGRPPMQMSYDALREELNYGKDPEAFKEAVNVLGEVRIDNPIYPSMEEAVVTSANGKETYNIWIANASNADANHKAPYHRLFTPLFDGSMIESEYEYLTMPDGSGVRVQSRAVDIFDENDRHVNRVLKFYDDQGDVIEIKAGTDAQGRPVMRPITAEELIQINDATNIHSPRRGAGTSLIQGENVISND